jgi:copper(I)-binding protein
MKWLLLSMWVWSIGAAAQVLQIREGYVREMPPGQSTSAAYMKLINTGARPIGIVAATSDSAGSAELHAQNQRGAMQKMTRVTRLEVPPRGQTVLTPGGQHLMLINLKRSFRAGDQIGITLLDEEGKSYSAMLPVVNFVNDSAPAAGQHQHHAH